MEQWIDESINNYLISANFDFEYCPGKIYVNSQYEEYPQEIRLNQLEYIIKKYSKKQTEEESDMRM